MLTETFINDLCNDMTEKFTTTIVANEDGKRPELPFIIVNVTAKDIIGDYDIVEIIDRGESVDVEKISDLKIALSINIHTKGNINDIEMDVLNYFNNGMFETLEQKHNAFVVEVTQMNNRNNLLNAEFNSINGFDVILRTDNKTIINKPFIEAVQL